MKKEKQTNHSQNLNIERINKQGVGFCSDSLKPADTHNQTAEEFLKGLSRKKGDKMFNQDDVFFALSLKEQEIKRLWGEIKRYLDMPSKTWDRIRRKYNLK